MFPIIHVRRLLGVSLLFAAASVGTAAPVSFSVDMSSQPGAAQVYVRGSFNNWGNPDVTVNGLLLTNDASGPTPSIYSGTVEIADAPGTVEACKFFYNPGDNWESISDRQFVLSGSAQVLPLTTWNVSDWPAPTNNVTFQIDMTQQVTFGNFDPNTGYVKVSGGFNGWGESIDFTNNPSASGAATNIYSQTLPITGYPGSQPGNYKFRAPIGDTWETINDRPSFTLTGGDQVLPLVYWNNVAPFTPTNDVTFRVDMTAQILSGNWTPGQFIRVAGAMTGWGEGVDLTNNPALSGNATNIYSMVIPVVANTNTTIEYKFRANGGYEGPTSANRSFQVAGGPQVLPLVFYGDASLCDLLQEPTTVTFVLRLTNGTAAIDGTVYDGSQTVHINGEFNGWAAWDVLLPQMVNNPIGSEFYEYTTVLQAGSSLAQKFKFSIGGPDNESPSFQDHIQYVRTTGTTYTMPVAQFGTNYASVRVENAFGNLTVGAPSGGNVPVTWSGLPCVTLQHRTSLTSGTWTDLPATDAASATNWPNAGSQFFRLQKRTTP
jgi:hypothetical protein